jgi:O-antigen/teichoic acid export membrane protein
MKDKALSLVFRGGGIGMKFLLILYLSKFKGTAILGTFSLFSTSILLSIYLMGMDYYTYSLRRTISEANLDDKCREIFSQFVFYLFSFLAFSILIFPWFFLFDWIDKTVIFIFLPLLLFELFSQELFRLFNAIKDIRTANLVYFIRNGSWIIIYFIFDFYFEPNSGILSIAVFWLCSSLMSVIISLLILQKKLNWRMSNLLDNVLIKNYKTGLNTAKIFFLSTILLKAIEYTNRYIIEFYWGVESVGVYSFYASISNVQVVACDVLIFSIVYPKLIENYNLGRWGSILDIHNSSLKNIIFINLVFVIFLPLGIKVFVNLYYGESTIKDYANTIFVLCLSSFFLNLSYIYHFILYAATKDIDILKSNAFVTLFGTILNFIFIKYYGIWGAVYATLITSTILVFLKYFYYKKLAYARI